MPATIHPAYTPSEYLAGRGLGRDVPAPLAAEDVLEDDRHARAEHEVPGGRREGDPVAVEAGIDRRPAVAEQAGGEARRGENGVGQSVERPVGEDGGLHANIC